METLGNKFNEKNECYSCENCCFSCRFISDWNRHITTSKHTSQCKLEINGNDWKQNSSNFTSNKNLSCEKCNKEFKTKSGLWKHKNKCSIDSFQVYEKKNDEPSDKELMIKILKQNSELIKENSELRKEQSDIKELILEIVKNGTHNTTNNTTNHTNSHNNAFNLNFFLNETCKNAMNITEFVDSIKLQLSDLMDVGELGYVEGISKIIVNNLNNLDETIRPIHCTDKKRETMYIKDEGQWEKDENKIKLKKAVKKVANKNIKLLPAFREKYPDYNNSSLRISDTHDKIVVEAMTSDTDKDDKIIKNILNASTIRKM
jgi:hypothetical protein